MGEWKRTNDMLQQDVVVQNQGIGKMRAIQLPF
jgi:hypothetical protein